LTPKEGQLPQGQGEQVMGACTLGRIEGFSMSIELNMGQRMWMQTTENKRLAVGVFKSRIAGPLGR
jgi:hypothetical protein